VHFTREPIIETIITPKEGHKLAIRSTKEGVDEYMVNAVEVVCIGNLYFLRSLEKPKAFLLPFSDYEILEVREVKMALKSSVLDHSIKIGQKTAEEEKRSSKKKRSRRSKKSEEKSVEQKQEEQLKTVEETQQDLENETKKTKEKRFEEKTKSNDKKHNKEDLANQKPKEPKKLVPPPTTLISETISRYKKILLPENEEAGKKDVTEEVSEEKPASETEQ